jgi:glycosyltransferase involved in cell wall biosynthesis
MSSQILVDVTQFASNPVGTGIQRTLLRLARHWPARGSRAEAGFQKGRSTQYSTLPLQAFGEIANNIVEKKNSGVLPHAQAAREITGALTKHVTSQIEARDIPERYVGYLLPEPTFKDPVLDTVELCAKRMGRRAMALVFDALPQTQPHLFAGAHQGQTDRYFLSIARLESLAFISARVHRELEVRLRHSAVPNALELPLGADAFGRENSPVPPSVTFVAPGTVEPRKRHELILDTFEDLWSRGREYRLRFLGSAGWVDDALIRRFRRAAEEVALFEWHDRVSDQDLAEAIRSASAALYVSDAEGYGLPPLEALALGCPVVVSANLPAMETLPGSGQIRLDNVTRDTVAAAVDRLADSAENAALRKEIRRLVLPNWRQVVEDLVAWIDATLDGCDLSAEPEPTKGDRE